MSRVGYNTTDAYTCMSPSLSSLKMTIYIGICAVLLLVGERPAAAQDAVHPMNGSLAIHCEDVSLSEALQMLEEAAEVSILFSDQHVYQRKLSGIFAGENAADILDQLLVAMPLHVHHVSDKQIVITSRTPKTQTPARVTFSGRVLDADSGTALEGATIYLKTAGKGVTASQDGSFELAQTDMGALQRDTIIVQHIGYTPVRVPGAALRPDNSLIVELSIYSVALDEVEVAGQRSAEDVVSPSAGQYRLVPEDLEWIPSASGETMIRTLQLLPGFVGGQAGKAQLIIRGSSPFQNLFQFNGITLYNTHHYFGFSSTVNEEIIGELDVYKGGFPAMYGGRTSGVLSATSTTGNVERLQASLGFNGLHAGGKINVPLNGKGAVQFAFRRSFTELFETELYKNLLDSSLGRTELEEDEIDVALPPERLSYSDLFGQFYYRLSDNLAFQTTLYHSTDRLLYSYFDADINISEDAEEPFVVDFDEQNDVEAETIGASSSLEYTWSEAAQTRLNVAFSSFTNDFIDNIRLFNAFYEEAFVERNGNELDDISVQLQHSFSLPAYHVDVGGFITRTAVGFNFQNKNNSGVFFDRAIKPGLFMQHTWQPEPRLLLSGGMRLTRYSLLEQAYLEPRAKAEFEVVPRITLKAAWGRYYQFIDRLDYLDLLDEQSGFWVLASDDDEIVPTRAIHHILGVRLEDERYVLDLEAYFNRLSGISELGPATEDDILLLEEEDYLYGDGVGEQVGVEFLARKKTGWFKGWASYVLARSQRQLPDRNAGTFYPTTQDFRHTASAVAQIATGPWQFSASWQFTSGQRFTEVSERYIFEDEEDEVERLLVSGPLNGQRLEAPHRLDVSLSRSFLLKNAVLNVGLSVYNAYNNRNIWRRDYNQQSVPIKSVEYYAPGRIPSLTMRVSFL